MKRTRLAVMGAVAALILGACGNAGEDGGGGEEAAANRVLFMADGRIVEENTPQEFFTNPQTDRAQDFLGKILKH